jgi:hypothetical protein
VNLQGKSGHHKKPKLIVDDNSVKIQPVTDLQVINAAVSRSRAVLCIQKGCSKALADQRRVIHKSIRFAGF